MGKGRWAALLAATVALWGCAGTESAGVGDDAVDASSPAPLDRRLGELREKRGLSAAERLELAELEAAAGNSSAAESAYYSALAKGGLTRSEQYRAQMGLGRLADQRSAPQASRPRFQEAWKLADTDAARDDALIELAEADLAAGDVAAARKHRQEVKNQRAPGLDQLDRLLEARGAAAPSPSPSGGGVSAGVGVSSQRAKGRGLRPPTIVPRASWGARAVLPRETEPLGKPTLITLHHTADRRPPGPAYADTMAQMRAYQNAHQGRKWADIGYHFVIDKAGRVVEGRPLHLKGAHAGSTAANERNVGIAMIGNFQSGQPTAKQLSALESLVQWLCAEYDIPTKRIYTHHEIKDWPGVQGATNCPGRNFDAHYVRLKKSIAAALAARR
jgi:hypothetical protein